MILPGSRPSFIDVNRPDPSAMAKPHQNPPGHIVGSLSEGRSRARSGWTRDAPSSNRRSGWRSRRMSEGPSRRRAESKTARHTGLRPGLDPLLPSRSQPLPRPPRPHAPAAPAPRDLLPLAWPIFRPVPSTSLVPPAREWNDAVYVRALPRQRPRHAGSASSPLPDKPNGRTCWGAVHHSIGQSAAWRNDGGITSPNARARLRLPWVAGGAARMERVASTVRVMTVPATTRAPCLFPLARSNVLFGGLSARTSSPGVTADRACRSGAHRAAARPETADTADSPGETRAT